MKRIAIYLRVSTSKQETSNQRRELEAVAKRSGWEIVKVYEDAGISGAKGRDGRPGLDAMLKAVNAKEFDLVATWSVRSARSIADRPVEHLAAPEGQGRRPLPASAGPRYLDHRRKSDVSNAGRVRRVCTRHHQGTGQRGSGPGAREWRRAWSHPAAPLQRLRHLEDRPRTRHRHLGRAARRRCGLSAALDLLERRHGPSQGAGAPGPVELLGS
jgi:hypothetical protein